MDQRPRLVQHYRSITFAFPTTPVNPMPWKEKTIEKLYWSIGEVAEQLGVNTSLIRYWEKELG